MPSLALFRLTTDSVALMTISRMEKPKATKSFVLILMLRRSIIPPDTQ